MINYLKNLFKKPAEDILVIRPDPIEPVRNSIQTPEAKIEFLLNRISSYKEDNRLHNLKIHENFEKIQNDLRLIHEIEKCIETWS